MAEDAWIAERNTLRLAKSLLSSQDRQSASHIRAPFLQIYKLYHSPSELPMRTSVACTDATDQVDHMGRQNAV